MRHISIDIETLGTIPGSAVLSIGYVVFDSHEGLGNQFYECIDLLDSALNGFTIDPVTAEWWSRQDKKAIHTLYNKPKPIITVLNQLSSTINRNDYMWAKGPDFDLVMLNAAFKKLNMRAPWSFRNARDVRTMIWLAREKNIKIPEKPGHFIDHFALHDAIYQAQQVTGIAEQLGVTLV